MTDDLDILAAIRDLRASPSTNFRPFRQFVLRSCLAKIAHRLDADQYQFRRPLEEILGDWRLLPGETFEPKQVLVPEPHRQSLLNRPASMIGNYCQWTPETAPQWIHLHRLYLVLAKTSVRNCRIRTVSNVGPVTPKIDGLRLSSLDTALSLLLVIMALPLGDVFDLPSMHMLLSSDRIRSAPDDVDDKDTPGLPGVNISGSVPRYLGNAVAWHRATQYVHKDAPMDPILEPAIVKALHALGIEEPNRRATLMQQVKDKLKAKTCFTSTLRCEASLMGLIIYRRRCGAAPELPDESNGARLATLPTIGVGKKCCWCCARLAKRLHLTHPEIIFDIPRSHGQIFPWALPPVGVTVDDALALESELVHELDRVVLSVVQNIGFPAMRSQMSSPSGSISSTASDLPDTTEVKVGLDSELDDIENNFATRRLRG
ncbi:hypothetical protein BS47DRAFT_1398707 [Hydnum rufescens UP504]|uniref:Uncharacterized protein n=1 Tax=Hydnum rufescens UP504 TaxID=1448309 RepID=A0A9P6AKB2_9AGAM|nr:hypothetical protein BS47DRAFT_1398707 [Hydnum rufescens UP504]